jgi:hypothetical protein
VRGYLPSSRGNPLGHLQTREVGEVLERGAANGEVPSSSKRARRRRRRRLDDDDPAGGDNDSGDEGEQRLAASAVSGQTPPAGPQWQRGLAPLASRALAFDKPLCASLDGFTLHAATCAGALDTAGREALLRYILRPPIAQKRVEPTKDGLVRIVLKRAFSDGCRRDGSVVSFVPAGDERAAAALPHREVRRRPRVGKQVARAHRAQAERCCAQRGDRGTRRARARAVTLQVPPLGRASS